MLYLAKKMTKIELLIPQKEESLLIERYDGNGLVIVANNYEWTDKLLNVFKEDKLVASFREDDIISVVLI